MLSTTIKLSMTYVDAIVAKIWATPTYFHIFGYNTFITGIDPQIYFPFPGGAAACLVLHLAS